jgi:hypothetical protein
VVGTAATATGLEVGPEVGTAATATGLEVGPEVGTAATALGLEVGTGVGESFGNTALTVVVKARTATMEITFGRVTKRCSKHHSFFP